MFSFLSSFPKKVLNAVFVLVLLVAIVGCDSNGNTSNDNSNEQGVFPPNLAGEWLGLIPGSTIPADYYVIEEDTLQYVMDDPEWGMEYTGNIRFVSNYSSSSGLIIIEYTQGASDPGKPFAGIYYKSLTSSTVQLANAINPDYSSADTTSLDEAVEKFTRNKMDTYVSYWGPYTKKTP